MSADNYLLIRRAGARYAVTDESASSDAEDQTPLTALSHPTPIDSSSVRWFETLEGALAWADRQHSEYGVEVDTERDAAWDTQAARLAAAAEHLKDKLSLRSTSGHRDEIVLDLGPVTVTITATGTPDAFDVADYLCAVLPESLATALAGQLAAHDPT